MAPNHYLSQWWLVISEILRPWWCHDMEMFSTLLTLCEGNPPVTGGFPSQRASNVDMLSLLSKCTSCCINNLVASDFRHLTLMWHHCNNSVEILILGLATSQPIQTSHYNNVIIGAMASRLCTQPYSTVCSDADQRKHQSSASLAFVRGIYQWPVNFLHKGPVIRKTFPLDDIIM